MSRTVHPSLIPVGMRLREARLAAGLSQVDLHRLIGYDVSHISRSELGKVALKGKFLRSLLSSLGLSEAWLLRGEGPMKADATPGNEGHFIERDDRYPNRAKAVQHARRFGAPEEALETVLSISLESQNDLSFNEWLDEIEVEVKRRKRGIVLPIESNTREGDSDSTGDVTRDALRRRAAYRSEKSIK